LACEIFKKITLHFEIFQLKDFIVTTLAEMLLIGGQSNFARCLPSPRLLHYTFSGTLAPDRILPGAKFTLCPSLAFSYIGSVTARHSSYGCQPNFEEWYKEWNYRTFAEGTTCIGLGSHHVWHWPTC